MMNIQEFRMVREYKDLGLSQHKTAKKLGLSEWEVRKVWGFTLDDFKNYAKGEALYLDKYRDYILDLIKPTPTMSDIAIYYRLMETFDDFDSSESNFHRYMKKLREDTGYARFKQRSTALRETPQPGEEAQVDFGQYKMLDMYGRCRIVYFIVIVLRYSELKYVYFSTDSFNTFQAIEAHKNAFKFFGGTPDVLVYDQDRVFVVSENYGNIILVKEFENFLRTYNLSVVMCGGYHPQSKGTVENYVKIVKNNFLIGRTYTGIDTLNSKCMEWLDNTENNHVLAHKGKTPHELFKEESKHLHKVKIEASRVEHPIHKVQNNFVSFHYAKYEVPYGYEGGYVTVESDGENVIIKDNDNGEVIATHEMAKNQNDRVFLKARVETESASEFLIRRYFRDDAEGLEFLDRIKASQPRYYRKVCLKLKVFSDCYTKEEFLNGIRFTMLNGNPTLRDLGAYLIWKYGDDKGKKAIGIANFYYYAERARELKEVIDGQSRRVTTIV